jgi:hypothetical protein
MPLTHKPNPMPSEVTYQPENSQMYLILRRNESFFSIAQLPQLVKLGISPMDLCYFNFRTRKPSEINWYLKNKVCCYHSTKDGKNYMFTPDGFQFIYIPKIGAILRPDEFPKTR